MNRLSLAILLAACGVALADPPSNDRRGGGPPRHGERGERPERGDRADRGDGRWRFDEKEVEAAEAFLAKHSPRRFKAYQELPSEERERVRPYVVMRYRGTQWLLKDAGEDLRKNKERQIELEDTIFGLRLDLLKAEQQPEKDKLTTDMRQAVSQLVDARMEERGIRISRLEKVLKGETEKLLADKAQREQFVEKALEEELKAGTGFIPDRIRNRPPREGDRPDND